MDNTNRIFLHKLLKAIGDSIINIFIPLYILKVTGQLELSILYLILNSVCVVVGMTLLKRVLCSHGLLCIILHALPIIITQGILAIFSINTVVVVICAVLMSLAQTLYSIPLNILFASADKSINVSKFQIATNVGKIFFILLSGLLLAHIPESFVVLCIVATIFYIASIVPLISTYHTLKVHTRVAREVDRPKVDIWYRLFHMTFSVFQITIERVIPLYLYINHLSFEAISSIIAIIELCKILANMLANVFVNRGHYKLSCTLSSAIFLGCLVGILCIKNAVVLYVLSCAIAISFPLCFVPMFYVFCDKIMHNKSVHRDMIDRDMDIFVIRPIYYGAYFVVGSLTPCIVFGLACCVMQYIFQLKIVNREHKLIAQDIKSIQKDHKQA